MLLRLNLAPVMGRRDAAYDVAAAAVAAGLTPAAAPELLRIAAGMERDSGDLLNMLSSPATIEREQNMLGHIRKVCRLLELLDRWRSGMPERAEQSGRAWDPVMLPVVREIADLLAAAGPHVRRYRSYASKSASASHAERYRKSYSFHLDIYKGRLPASNTGKSEP